VTGRKQRTPSPLFEALDQELRRRPYGTISAMERALGWSTGWWHGRIRAGDVSTNHMLAILDFLGLDPVAFVRRQVGSPHGLELDRPQGEAPEIVKRAWERFRSGEEGTGVGETFLQSLDSMRYADPAGALALAEGSVAMVELELLPRLLGVVGSIFRMQLKMEEAQHAIHAGVEVAVSLNDHRTIGRLIQRLGYVFADMGDHERALCHANAAASYVLQVGDHRALGPVMVDQGIWLYYLERYEDSLRVHRAAYEFLAPEEKNNRIAALQYQALCWKDMGNLEEAFVFLRRAKKEAGSENRWAGPKLNWLEGELLRDLGQFDQAVEYLQKAIDHFRRVHLGEAALVTCDLIRAWLMQGKGEEAYLAARELLVLLEPLRGNRIISSAIADLLRGGQIGLSLALVDTVFAQIQSEHSNRRNWHSLWVRQ
jgi:tetratricopeptide (TPR) repeat protein